MYTLEVGKDTEWERWAEFIWLRDAMVVGKREGKPYWRVLNLSRKVVASGMRGQ